jgi:hypothetical protein
MSPLWIDSVEFLRDDGWWIFASSETSPTSRRLPSVVEFESDDVSNGGTAGADGENGKVGLKFGWQTVRSETPNSTGTKRPASVGRN